MDNASIHHKKEAELLGDWLWDNHNILILPLPTYTLEYNPIEHMWRTLKMRLKTVRRLVREDVDICANACAKIMDNFTFNEVYSAYNECFDM